MPEISGAPCAPDNVLNFPSPEERAARADKNAVPTPQGIAAQLRGIHSETFWHLPFVTLPETAADSWGEFWTRVVMWNDEPTDKPGIDFQRGRQYARLAIGAMRQDGTCARQIEITVDRMIAGAFLRRGPGGKLCRQLSSAEHGFIIELCRAAVRDGIKTRPS